jgi:hypothetical protein
MDDNLEHFPLDENAVAAMNEITQQEKALLISRQAILSYFARVHKMQGSGWRLSEDQTELVRPSEMTSTRA